jgi:hypothetical protein
MADVRVTGLDQHLAAMARRREKMRENITLGLIEYGGFIEEVARQSILDGGIPSPNHIPSAPGEPPNADTHALDRSLHTRFQGEGADNAITGVGNDESGLETRVTVEVVAGGPTAPYAVPLETGTSRMAARPYMGPASLKAKAQGQVIMRRAVAKTMQE